LGVVRHAGGGGAQSGEDERQRESERWIMMEYIRKVFVIYEVAISAFFRGLYRK
jgi:hypothetical protein